MGRGKTVLCPHTDASTIAVLCPLFPVPGEVGVTLAAGTPVGFS